MEINSGQEKCTQELETEKMSYHCVVISEFHPFPKAPLILYGYFQSRNALILSHVSMFLVYVLFFTDAISEQVTGISFCAFLLTRFTPNQTLSSVQLLYINAFMLLIARLCCGCSPSGPAPFCECRRKARTVVNLLSNSC